jgi:hypothetical protein
MNIETNVTELKTFDANCVADLECLGIEIAECKKTMTVSKVFGVDERYFIGSSGRKTPITANKNSTHGTFVDVPTTVAYTTDITELTYATEVDTEFTTNVTFEVTPSSTKNEEAVTKEVVTSIDPTNKLDLFDVDLEDFLEYPPTDPTDVDKNDVEILDDLPKLNKTNATEDKFGKMQKLSNSEESEKSRLLAFKIVGATCALVAIGLLFAAKNYILNCFQSGTYRKY